MDSRTKKTGRACRMAARTGAGSVPVGDFSRWSHRRGGSLDQGACQVVKHYSQALHPDGKLWRVIYELRWVPRLALVGVLIWGGTMAFDRDPPFRLHSYWTNQPEPGELNLQIPIPINFPPGPAVLTTVLEYRCNALQDVLRPINVELNMPFEVLS